MDLLPLSVVLILIGIPALIGAFNVCANIGKESVRNGVGVLIYAGALAAGFAIVLPQGTIVLVPSDQYAGALRGIWRHDLGPNHIVILGD